MFFNIYHPYGIKSNPSPYIRSIDTIHFPLSLDACLREAPPAKVLLRRAGASVKARERAGVRVQKSVILGAAGRWLSTLEA
jgi:hypothetical protein